MRAIGLISNRPFLLPKKGVSEIKIFQGFLVLVAVALLWMLPIPQSVYDFRTDIREETTQAVTGLGVTTFSTVLDKPIYDDDTQTIILLSDNPLDIPVVSTYTAPTRTLLIDGLNADDTRTLTISFDIDSLNAHPAFNTVLNIIPYFWILILVVFPVVSLIVIIRR